MICYWGNGCRCAPACDLRVMIQQIISGWCPNLTLPLRSTSKCRRRNSLQSSAIGLTPNWLPFPAPMGPLKNMPHRAKVGAKVFVLVTGASSGMGSATVQLAKRRGATVADVTTPGKSDQLRDLDVDIVVERGSDYASQLGEKNVEVVVDNMAGPFILQLLKLLKPRGHHVSSGAIAGTVVVLAMRNMYMKDITLIDCTRWDKPVFPTLISYIDRGEIRPILAKTFPLDDIAQAQEEFLEKKHFGNFVLKPPVPQSLSFPKRLPGPSRRPANFIQGLL